MNRLKQNILIYIIIVAALIGSLYEVYSNTTSQVVHGIHTADYSEPPFTPIVNGSWNIQSIDTQVISKHWPNVTRQAIVEQVNLIKNLGVNYIAVDTPYDKVDELRMWVQEIHRLGLHVWFRSHWDKWEGDDGKPAIMSPQDYLDNTSSFIKANPDIFLPGDSFTVAVEPEQVGVGLGQRFLTWDSYRKFLLDQVEIANLAFQQIGLKGKVYTNWISVNGWVVQNQFTTDLVKKLGLITIDHYVGQNKTIGDFSDANVVVSHTISDLDNFHNKWAVPILIGEWGYQIFQPVPDNLQADVINRMFSAFKSRSYIIGVNYWVHMGNTASIIGDQYGSNLKYRLGANVIKSFFDTKILQ